MTVYYNEIEPYAAAWLRNLIAAGHIAPGDVDERDIRDVRPDELRGYTQCHFFAGIGVWSYALRRAGWPDDRPVWTGSCPCQPFSAAGRGAGFSDERHLWPHFHWLISQCRPPVVVGEQVASKDGLGWLDLVQADLEGSGYACGAVDLCAAGVGAPHIRQRLWWVGEDRLADPAEQRRLGWRASQAGFEPRAVKRLERLCDAGLLGDAFGAGLEGQRRHVAGEIGWPLPAGSASEASSVMRPRPTNGFWRDADWLLCRDGKWRPVEPRAQSLVDGSTESLGRVRPGQLEDLELEVAEWSIRHQADAREALLDLRRTFSEEAFRGWTPGRLPDVHEAPVLLAFLRQLEEQWWAFSECVSGESTKAAQERLRVLWGDGAAARASCERGLDGQPTGERADALRLLSSILARHAQEAWGAAYEPYAAAGFPLAHGARARVGRLRAYGNAIVAEAAQAFVEAYLDSVAERLRLTERFGVTADNGVFG